MDEETTEADSTDYNVVNTITKVSHRVIEPTVLLITEDVSVVDFTQSLATSTAQMSSRDVLLPSKTRSG